MAPILKSSPLARQVRKWERQIVRDKEKTARERKADREWRGISQAVQQRDGGKCRVCKVHTFWGGNPALIGQAHHILYRSAGGTDDLKNLIWLCGGCHEKEHLHQIEITGTATRLKVKG